MALTNQNRLVHATHGLESEIETPAFVYDLGELRAGVATARDALAGSGARLLLAMKAFSFEPGLREIAPLLDGLHASSPFEARLARRVLDEGIIHTTSPGLRDRDVTELVGLTDLLSFNSLGQWRRYREVVAGRVSPGLRVNPQLSFVEDERYDPAARNSKLGTTVTRVASVLESTPGEFDWLDGLLVHNNCESVHFEDLLMVVEMLCDRLGPLLEKLTWIDLGGGYLFAEAADREPLHAAVKLLRDSYGLDVVFEPGTSLVNRAGSIIATVVDIIDNGGVPVAVLDTSTSHLPEVLEFHYTPNFEGCGGDYRYLVAGASCLASDVFGEHCFLAPLEVGSRVEITDVGAYSLVKASWFNGIPLPTVYRRSAHGTVTLERRYTFDDFMAISGGSRAHH